MRRRSARPRGPFVFQAPTRRTTHAEGRHPHSRRPREAQAGDRVPLHDKRREVAERIKEAREFGDISENSEYDDAKNEQAMLESRIAPLEDKLRSAPVIDASELDTTSCASARRSTSRTRRASRSSTRSSARPRPTRRRTALQRVAGRQGAGGPQEGRRRSRCPLPKAARAEGHQDRRRLAQPWRERGRRSELAAKSCSTAGASSRRCGRRASSRSRTPSPGVKPIAEAKAPHEDLAGGEETDGARARRRPPGRAPRPGQGGVPRPRRPLGAHAAARARRRARRGARWRGCSRSTSATCSASTARSSGPAAASCRCGRRLGRCSRSRCVRRPTSTTG